MIIMLSKYSMGGELEEENGRNGDDAQHNAELHITRSFYTGTRNRRWIGAVRRGSAPSLYPDG